MLYFSSQPSKLSGLHDICVLSLLSILLRDGVSQNVLDEMTTTCNFKRNKMRNFTCISFRFYPFIHPPFDRGLESGAQSHLHGSSCNFYLIEKFAPREKGAENTRGQKD